MLYAGASVPVPADAASELQKWPAVLTGPAHTSARSLLENGMYGFGRKSIEQLHQNFQLTSSTPSRASAVDSVAVASSAKPRANLKLPYGTQSSESPNVPALSTHRWC